MGTESLNLWGNQEKNFPHFNLVILVPSMGVWCRKNSDVKNLYIKLLKVYVTTCWPGGHIPVLLFASQKTPIDSAQFQINTPTYI